MGKHNELRYSPEALNDLNEILSYINDDLKNPLAARDTLNAILDSIDKLKIFPEIGSPLSAVTGIESDYRFIVCGNYIAFYRAEAHAVYIDRILYGRRDYLRILFENNNENE